jgi:hypothetical protein
MTPRLHYYASSLSLSSTVLVACLVSACNKSGVGEATIVGTDPSAPSSTTGEESTSPNVPTTGGSASESSSPTSTSSGDSEGDLPQTASRLEKTKAAHSLMNLLPPIADDPGNVFLFRRQTLSQIYTPVSQSNALFNIIGSLGVSFVTEIFD